MDQKDLVVALIGSSDGVNEKLLGNTCERVRNFMEEEMSFLTGVEQDEIDAVKMRTNTILCLLADQGQVTWPPGDSPKKGPATPKPKRLPKAYLAAKEKAAKQAQQPLAELALADLDALFTSLAEIARREGILALEKIGEAAGDPFTRMAIQLVVDGTQPEIVTDMLST